MINSILVHANGLCVARVSRRAKRMQWELNYTLIRLEKQSPSGTAFTISQRYFRTIGELRKHIKATFPGSKNQYFYAVKALKAA